MGWLFGWHTRKDLIRHLTQNNMAEGSKMLAHCCVGNNLWAVQEYTNHDGELVRFIALYLMRGHNNSRDGWGYKDLDEGCGPVAVNCPLKYIDMVKDFEPRSYAKEWREKVREYWAKRARNLTPGTRIRLYDKEYTVTGRPFRNHDYSVKDEYGDTFRVKKSQLAWVEVLNG